MSQKFKSPFVVQDGLDSDDSSGAISLREARRSAYSLPSTWLSGCLLFIAALTFNLYRIGTPSVWFDEAFSVELAGQPLPLLWRLVSTQEPNMGLYHLFLHGWLSVANAAGFLQTEAVVRLPSAIFAALGTVVVFLLGRRVRSNSAGIVAAALYLLNDWQLVYAQQARAYSLQVLLLCLSWYALLSILARPRATKWYWIIYVSTSVLAIYTHLFSVVILGTQVLALAVVWLFPGLFATGEARKHLRSHIQVFLGCFALVLVLSLPMLLLSRTADKTGWLPQARLSDLLYFWHSVSGNSKYYLLAMLAMLAIAVGLVFWSRLVAGRGQRVEEVESHVYYQTLWGWLLLCWLLVPIVSTYLISQGSIRLFSARYLIVVVPALTLVLAYVIGNIRWRLPRFGLALVLLALAVMVVPFYYRSAQVEDWNSATAWVQEHFQDGDGMICYDNSVQQGCQVAVEYYLHAYPGPAHFEVGAPGEFSWENMGPARTAGPDEAVDPMALQTFASRHQRLIFIVGRLPDDAAANKTSIALNWLQSQYHLESSFQKRTVQVYLYTVR
ncbi:glycosyltransferase family 39 protein [Ktedonobacter robiniae]|uniref:Glycosyltransferase RgtA/B/C/D-like domain-containing protein n=1 Tax=Ktedonobacter robiniae TaxID=2778365 RepID=A0ABQ3UNV4_9CHLR|nr:glycosyltransferase family 39 protein [Ktedonobacter robiniae]GHO54055.1 hypothetical protein KSB_25300 [Ktedonobacter robiniae]